MNDKRVVASFRDYAAAQSVVDALSDERFPVEQMAIVGVGLRSHEQITGRRGHLRATIESAVSGAIVGALLGWLFGLFSLVEPLVTAFVLGIWGALIGGVLGALLGLAGYAVRGRKRDFASIRTMTAERYDILAENSIADDTERAIDAMRPVSATGQE